MKNMSSSVDKHYDIVYVQTLPQALKMRKIRNELRDYMTHNTDEITVWQQTVWFYKLMRSDNRAFLVVTSNGDAIGYGLVMNRDGEWTVTGGLLKNYRGIGIGRVLFRYLTQVALMSSGKDVYLDVRASNGPAVKLYVSLGYQPIAVDEVNSVIKMKWTGKLVDV